MATELERMIAESNLLQDTRRALEKAIQDCEPPLHIAQECLYHRENRQGICYFQFLFALEPEYNHLYYMVSVNQHSV